SFKSEDCQPISLLTGDKTKGILTFRMPFTSSAVWLLPTAVCACPPAFADDSARVAGAPVCSPPADALAAAHSAVQAAGAEPARFAEAARIGCAAADDSSLDAADLAPADSLAERSAAPWKGAPRVRAAGLADSYPAGCMQAGHCSVPDDSAGQRAVAHCAMAAQRDGYQAGYLEPVGSAGAGNPDWADSIQAGSIQAGSIQAGWVAVGWAAVGCSAHLLPADCWAAVGCLAHLLPADCWAAQRVDDRCVPAAQM